jgi:hypothetical protein
VSLRQAKFPNSHVARDTACFGGALACSIAEFALSPSLLSAQPHDNIDSDYLVTFRWGRRVADKQIGRGNVHHLVLILDEKVMVSGIVGVKVGSRGVDAT